MRVKLVFLLFFLQLWHISTSFQIPQTLTLLSDSSKCVASCGKFNVQFGNKLYYIESREKVNWYKAVNNCRKMGGYLLNIESALEMDLFAALLPVDRHWTSSNSLAKTFLSITTGKPMPYNRWKKEHLANDPNKCVEMTNGFLKAENCETLMYYVCQAKILY